MLKTVTTEWVTRAEHGELEPGYVAHVRFPDKGSIGNGVWLQSLPLRIA